MKPQRVAKWIGGGLIGIVLLVIIVSLLAYVIVLLPPVQNHIRTIAEKHLDSLLVGDISIGFFKTNLLTSATVSDIKINNVEGRKDSIAVGRISVNYSLPSLLSRTIHVTSIIVEDVFVYLSRNPDGDLMLPGIPKMADTDTIGVSQATKDTSSASFDWNFVIGKARIKNLNAIYNDSALAMFGEISKTSIIAKFPRLDSFTVDLDVPDAYYTSPWWEGRVDTIGAMAYFNFDGIAVENVYVNGSGSEVTGKGYIPFDTAGTWDLSAHVSSRIEPITIVQTLLPDLAATGHVTADALWEGTLQQPVLKVDFSGSHVRYQTYEVDTIHIAGRYTKEEVMQVQSYILSPIAEANVVANADIPKLFSGPSVGHYDIRTQVEPISIATLQKKGIVPEQFPGEYGNLILSAKGKGVATLPTYASLKTAIRGGKLEVPIRLNAGLNYNEWDLESTWGENSIKGSGTVNIDGPVSGNFALQFPQPSLVTSFFTTERIRGALYGKVAIAGTIDDPSITSEIFSNDLRWRSVRTDTLFGAVKYAHGKVAILDAFMEMEAGLDSLLSYFGVDSAEGIVKVKVQGEGSVDKPIIRANIEASYPEVKGFEADTIHGDIALIDLDTIRWERLWIEEKQSAIETNGELVFQPKLRANSKIEVHKKSGNDWHESGTLIVMGWWGNDTVEGDLKVNDLDISGLSAWIPIEEEIKGNVSAIGHVRGPVGNLEGNVDLKLYRPTFKDQSIASFDGKIRMRDSLINADAHVLLDDSSSGIAITGQLPVIPSKGFEIDLSGYRAATVEVKGDSLNLTGIAGILGNNWYAWGPTDLSITMVNEKGNWNVDGFVGVKKGEVKYTPRNIHASNLNMETKISGTLEAPEIVFSTSTGLIRLSSGQINSFSLDGRSGLDTLHIDTARMVLQDDGLVEMSAFLPLKQMDSLLVRSDLAVDFTIVKFPLPVLSSFLPNDIIRTGHVEGEGRILIRNGRPMLNGKLELIRGEFALPEIEPSMGPVHATIRMDESTVIVQEIRGGWGKGTFRSTGTMEWNTTGLNSINLGLRMKDISFEMPGVVTVAIASGNIHLSDRRGGYLLSGDINMGPTRVIKDIGVADLIEQAETSGGIKQEPNPFLQKLTLQMKIDMDENLTVDMNLGLLNVDGQIAIAGTAAKPAISGEIRIQDGYVWYLDRKFEIIEGFVYNPDPYEINPTVELRAETDIITYTENEGSQSYHITLSISGDLEHPVVQLSGTGDSEQLTEADIISLLTLGQRLGAVGSDLADRVKSFAAQRLTGFGARKLERLLGLERIDISGDLFANGNGDEEGPRLSVTKQLSPRLSVTYETEVGNLNERNVMALFRITRHLFLEGQANSEGKQGLDLLFKFSK